MIFLGVVSFMMLVIGWMFIIPPNKRSNGARIFLQVLCGLGGAGCTFVVIYAVILSQIVEYDITGWLKTVYIIFPYLISIAAGLLMGLLPGKVAESK